MHRIHTEIGVYITLEVTMEQDAQTQQIITNLVVRSATQIAEGKSRESVVAELEKDGCPSELAQAIVTRGEEIKKSQFRKGGQTTMMIGAGICIIGIAVTVGTHDAAVNAGGGKYIIAGGAIIGGAWIFIKGLWRSMVG